MAVIFVNGDTGNDGNAGTEALPKLTIQAAVTAAVAGDTVVVLPASVIYRERVVVDTKERIRITSLPTAAANGMARVSPATSTQAANWTSEGSNVYSIVDTVSGIDELDVDPYVIFDTQEVTYADQKMPRKAGTFADGAAIIAGLTAGTYRYLSPKLYYKRPQSNAPINNEIRVPNHKTASDEIAAFVIKSSSYITLENIQVEEFGRYGVFVASTSSRCVVRNVVCKNGVGDGIHVEGQKNSTDRCTVTNIAPQIESSAQSSVFYMSDVFPASIALKNATNCIVSHNSVSTFVGAGIYTTYPAELSNGTTTGVYGDNVIFNNTVSEQRASPTGSYTSGALYGGLRGADASHFDYWRGNTAYHCNDTAIVAVSGRKNLFFNNTVSKCARGYLFQTARDNVLANNLFYRTGTMAGPFVSSQQSWNVLDTAYAGYHLVEGLFYYTTATAAQLLDLESNILRKNLYYRATGSPLFCWGITLYSSADWITNVAPLFREKADADMLLTDPAFVDYATNDYHLTTSSPAIDAAASVTSYGESSSAAYRYATQKMPQRAALDMGAYELEDTPISTDDLRLLLTRARPSSGGTGPSAAFLTDVPMMSSLGGNETTRYVVGTLWGPVDKTEIPASGTYIQYRAIDVKNVAITPTWVQHTPGSPTTNSATDSTASNVKFYFTATAPLTAAGTNSTAVAAGWESAAPFNAAVASEVTVPADVTFSTPITSGTASAVPSTGVSGGGTGPTLVGVTKTAVGQTARLWVRRTTHPTAEFKKQAKPIIRIFATGTAP